MPCSAVLDAQVRREMKSEPAIGESGERGQGDVMYAEFDVVVEAQARVLSDVVVDRDFTIVRGTSLKPETEAGRVRYCTVDEKKRLLGIASPRRVCLYSEQKPTSFTNIFT